MSEDEKPPAEHTKAIDKQKTRSVKMTDDVFYVICERIAQGEMLTNICAEESMPGPREVYRYLHKAGEKAREVYYDAREMQQEALADEILAISYDDSKDWSIDDRGRRVSHNDVVQRARLKTDNLKWTMAKLAPKRFGEKNTTEISGAGGAPVAMTIITGVPRSENSLIRRALPEPKIIEGEKVTEGNKDG